MLFDDDEEDTEVKEGFGGPRDGVELFAAAFELKLLLPPTLLGNEAKEVDAMMMHTMDLTSVCSNEVEEMNEQEIEEPVAL